MQVEGEPRADYTLEIVCDHRHDPGSEAAEARVAVIYHVPAPPGRIGFLEWREATWPDRASAPALETWFGRLRSLTRDMSPERRNAIMRSWDEQERLLRSRTDGKIMDTERWRFECPECGLSLTYRHQRLEPYLARLRDSAVSRLTMHAVRSMMSM